MPFKCIVPFCKSNYDSEDNKKSVFSFPRKEILRQKWINSIPRKNLTVNKNSRVCELHFTETDIQRETSFFDSSSGKRISITLEKPRLREGAIPSIFRGCPSYLTKEISHRESGDDKNLRMKDLAATMAIQPTDNTEVMEVDLTSEMLPTTKQPIMNGVSSTKKGSSNFELILQNSNSSSIDINGFLSMCRDSVVENCKGEMDILMQDINKSILSATNTLHQTERSAQNLINFITSKHSVFKMPVNCNQQNSQVKTYCKNTVTNNAHSTSILNSNRKDVTGDGLEILNTVTSIPKANLPPAGELIRSPLETGTRVWAMKTNLLNVWVRGTITNIRATTPDKLYKVRLDSQKFISQKFYNAKQLAYENPASVIVPVGTRIIARYTDSAGRSAHYAGIVAEPPKVTNLKRYLIFFDDGCAQYVTHEDIYVVCAQSIDVADDCHENMNDFVRGYLQQYPERPMVKLQKDQFVKTEYNSEWSDAKVLEVDCSMVKMKFMTSQRIEWIYRGSTRLKPLRNELANAEAHRLEGKNRRRHTFPRRPHQPYVEYTREEYVVVIDSDSDDEKSKVSSMEIKSDKPRNTARKSLTTRPFKVHQRFAGPMFFRSPDKKSHLGVKEIDSSRHLSRVQFYPHDCSILCKEKDNPVKHKETNPLVIPINFGWERQLRRFRIPGPGVKIIITYRTPCGRHLRSLQEIQDYLYLVDSKITIDMFSFSTNVVVFRSFKPLEVLYNDDDITRGKENTRVPCINSLSDEPPPYVEYSAERFAGEGVYLNLDPDFLCGCECTDNCQNAATCACQQLTNYARYGKLDGDAGYKFRRLTEALVTGVYECNSRCRCNSKCGNRVVQNGITVRLQMFKTLYKGWGIRCLDDLDAGQFICIYAGQLLTEQGADIGGKECGDEYLAELDHIEVVEKAKEGYESDVPEFEPMEVDKNKMEVDKEDNYVASSEDQYSSDSDVLFADSDSEFESSLKSTATSTYATRSRQRHGKKSSTNSSVDNLSNILSEDSGSSHDNSKKDIKGLPDLSTNLETFKINPQPPSPESAEMLDKIELKRKPKISDEVDMDTPKNSPENIKMESSGLDERSKCDTSSDSQNTVDIKVEETCDGKKVVAKKSVSMKNPLTSFKCEQQEYKFKSVRSYFGEDSLYIMDARSKGNIGRYLNHSCEPNVFVQNVFVDTHDLRFPTVAFFAFDAIDAGTELTWDYNYEVNSVADKIMYCYCEAPSCRGRLL